MGTVPRQKQVGLAEVLDRVLDKGAVVTGEMVITVAGIELVYVALNVVATSVGTAIECKRLAEEP